MRPFPFSTPNGPAIPAAQTPPLTSRRQCLQLGLAGLLGGSGPAHGAEVTTVRYPPPESPLDSRSLDVVALLDAALRRTEASHGPYRLEPSPVALTEPRQFIELEAGSGLLDVLWAAHSLHRPQRLRPLNLDLRRGLLGMRVALVDRQRLTDFASIADLAALRRFSVGQGQAWQDVDVYQASGVRVVTSAGYETLFRMLLAGRFDLFPRGIGEAFEELQSRRAEMPRLAVEPGLLLVYPFPYHFYFGPSQAALATRVEQGLMAMKADGSFDAHLWQRYGPAVARARLRERRVLRLSNPHLGRDAEREADANLAYWMNPPAYHG